MILVRVTVRAKATVSQLFTQFTFTRHYAQKNSSLWNRKKKANRLL